MLVDFIVAFALAFCIYMLLQWLKSYFMGSCPRCKGIAVKTELSVSGAATGLEHSVRSLLWLQKRGSLPGELCIRDCGMDEETADVARKMAQKYDIELIF